MGLHWFAYQDKPYYDSTTGRTELTNRWMKPNHDPLSSGEPLTTPTTGGRRCRRLSGWSFGTLAPWLTTLTSCIESNIAYSNTKTAFSQSPSQAILVYKSPIMHHFSFSKLAKWHHQKGDSFHLWRIWLFSQCIAMEHSTSCMHCYIDDIRLLYQAGTSLVRFHQHRTSCKSEVTAWWWWK